MAMIALALRYSNEPFFEGRHSEVIESYCRTAWNEIFEKAFSEDYVLDIHAVQATNMLAIVDFTGTNPPVIMLVFADKESGRWQM